jgi:hypothetical protein
MEYVLPRLACHNSAVGLRRLPRAGVLALALASFGCHQSAVECVQLPVVACPDGGGPSFTAEVLPIFVQVCDDCHAPGGTEANRPLTNYQEIYGSGGTEASEIRAQVFDSCSMPPPTTTESLTEDQRQTLHVWLACGALDSPAVDAGAAN